MQPLPPDALSPAHIWIAIITIATSIGTSIAIVSFTAGQIKKGLEAHEQLDQERHANIQLMFGEIRGDIKQLLTSWSKKDD